MSAAFDSASSLGIIRQGSAVRSKRLQNAVTLGVPFAGSVYAIASGVEITGVTVGVFALFFSLGALGIGIGLHRYFAHHAFRTGPVLRATLGVLASWAWQGSVSHWVADHRRHHRFADGPFDPHSPHWQDGEPTPSLARGLLHSHLTWMLTADVSDPQRYANDIEHEPIASWCSRNYWVLAVSTLVLPAGLGFAIGGAGEAISCLLIAGFLRVAILQHVTWAIASLGHSFGVKLPEAKDEARNSVVLALLLFGEGLHSYHHAYPRSAVNQPAHLDLNGAILRLWARMGWAWDLKQYN